MAPIDPKDPRIFDPGVKYATNVMTRGRIIGELNYALDIIFQKQGRKKPKSYHLVPRDSRVTHAFCIRYARAIGDASAGHEREEDAADAMLEVSMRFARQLFPSLLHERDEDLEQKGWYGRVPITIIWMKKLDTDDEMITTRGGILTDDEVQTLVCELADEYYRDEDAEAFGSLGEVEDEFTWYVKTGWISSDGKMTTNQPGRKERVAGWRG